MVVLFVMLLSSVAFAADAGYDADVGVPDTGSFDAGSPDAGDPDAGYPDAGDPDAGDADGADEESTDQELEVVEEPDEVDMDALADEVAEEVAGETFDEDPVIAEDAGDEELDEESFRVDTVLISAEELARVGGAAARIDEEDLEALEYDDPNSVLQQVPSTFVRREDGFGLRPNIGIRGANSERSKKITLMEDGILFAPAPYSAPAAYYFPMASRMVGVEVYKGPAAIRFGPHTVGGAVNWVTRRIPGDETAGVDLNFGSYLTGKLHSYYGKSWDHFGFLVEGVQWQSNGYKELDGGGNTGFNKSELMAKARVNSDLAGQVYHALQTKLGYSRELSNETYLGLTDDDFRATPDRRYAASALDQMTWGRTQAELRYRLEVGDDFDLTATAYRHDFDRAWRKVNGFADPTSDISNILANPTGRREVFYDILRGEADSATPGESLLIGTNDRSFVSQGVDVTANYRTIGDAFENEVRFGTRVHHDSIVRERIEESFRMESGELVAEGGPTDLLTNSIGRTMAYSAYLMDELQFWRLTIVPGVRAEFVDGELEDVLGDETQSNFQTAVLPGLGLFVSLTDELGLLAGAHRGFSPVSPGQPQEVEPEFSTNYEAGGRLSIPSSRRLLEVVGFLSDYQNLLGACSFSAGCEEDEVDDQFNAGSVSVYGLEAVASHRIRAASSLAFPVRAAYTYTGSHFRSTFTSSNPQFGDVEVGDELPYVPEHQLSLRLGMSWADFTTNVQGTWVTPMREEAGQDDDDVRTDAQYLVDLLISYEVVEGLSLYGKVDNVLNQRPIVSRRPFGARPARPLLVQGGVRWQH